MFALRPSFFMYPRAEICTSDTVKCSGANLDHHDLCELPRWKFHIYGKLPMCRVFIYEHLVTFNSYSSYGELLDGRTSVIHLGKLWNFEYFTTQKLRRCWDSHRYKPSSRPQIFNFKIPFPELKKHPIFHSTMVSEGFTMSGGVFHVLDMAIY